MTVFEGALLGEGLRFAIVVSRFNQPVTSGLLEGALDTLRRHGTRDQDIDIAWVPGAFELPLVAARMARSRRYDAVLCLGAVLRGATAHFDFVAGAAAQGIARAALDTGVPVIFGVITCETLEQAVERTGVRQGNRGAEAALAALEMANLMRVLPGEWTGGRGGTGRVGAGTAGGGS
ncbi:MAG: 6,7-dimethyl-8-ribityllumazine synthase [Bacillota bacterium]|nr:MAG: 6,7-dimethyl-8-ribityllumazine synthase [Bacillota bacterium]